MTTTLPDAQRRHIYASHPVSKRTENGEDDGDRCGQLDADRIEEDWNRALDAASDAATASGRAHALNPKDVSEEAAHIRSEREWLSRFRPSLRKLFPRRHRR